MLKHVWTIFKVRILFIFVTIFLIFPFGAFISKLGFGCFSVFVCMAYLPFVYFDARKAAKYDKKSYNNLKTYQTKGFLIGFISEIPSVIILLILLIFKSTGAYKLLNIIYIGIMVPFIGFLGLPNYLTVFYYFPLLIIPITAGLGYLSGYKDFTFYERVLPKILYKDKNDSQ